MNFLNFRALAEASVDEVSAAPAFDLRPDAGGSPWQLAHHPASLASVDLQR